MTSEREQALIRVFSAYSGLDRRGPMALTDLGFLNFFGLKPLGADFLNILSTFAWDHKRVYSPEDLYKVFSMFWEHSAKENVRKLIQLFGLPDIPPRKDVHHHMVVYHQRHFYLQPFWRELGCDLWVTAVDEMPSYVDFPLWRTKQSKHKNLQLVANDLNSLGHGQAHSYRGYLLLEQGSTGRIAIPWGSRGKKRPNISKPFRKGFRSPKNTVGATPIQRKLRPHTLAIQAAPDLLKDRVIANLREVQDLIVDFGSKSSSEIRGIIGCELRQLAHLNHSETMMALMYVVHETHPDVFDEIAGVFAHAMSTELAEVRRFLKVLKKRASP